MASSRDERPVGLRERKKARTRAAIQDHALRLFIEQGYAETTVEQIAAAAEVSPSTFFRYFPTKEDTVLYDRLDPVLIEAFVRQPAELSPIAAVRAAIHEVFTGLDAEESELERARQRLVLGVPELRGRLMDQVADGVGLLVDGVARRTGRAPDDLAVRAWSGAVVGVCVAAFLTALVDPDGDPMRDLDAALAQLEAGLPL
ncbi:DNA-binding transcriptional regulator, AcrR family [Amycolatopsis arida]|uniref:DNA-binding transcriptional regulator, AcrR family n=1 Tax=Amycolatopsis arida TaxID=587909 RepID=A0A1I5S737_9PSEU|nr:TetR family transcriptional regulator [Amycolatopsis arida]TDX85306.1 AcrR family transcriptional regulator [Amycolatopsis arida]SFP66529.1 DNA-binding transcriptional regulator, AcrR family [Amycolatopsis arida]